MSLPLIVQAYNVIIGSELLNVLILSAMKSLPEFAHYVGRHMQTSWYVRLGGLTINV